MQKRIPAVLMRGGTSKGLFFHERDLPADPAARERVILAAYGSPDPYRRQIDGIGGAQSVTSKVAVISSSPSPDYDVVYHFGQVSIDRPIVDYKANCGNMSSAVGPFAVDEGLVAAVEPVTRVRIHQKNTDKLIIAEVPVRDGAFDPTGDYAIDGVPGTGSRILLRFVDPAGAVTGRLFPTGRRRDRFDIAGLGAVDVSCVDAANPFVFVRAESLNLKGTEAEEIERNAEIKSTLEAVRCRAAVALGITATEEEATRRSQAVPKVALVAAPRPYLALNGRQIESGDVDLLARMMSMGNLHRTYAVSGAVAAAGAAMIPGTIVNDLLSEKARGRDLLRIGHPGGVIEVGAVIESRADEVTYREAVLGRTSRRLMEGSVLVSEHCFG
ncbi:MAG: 3-methylitaconate isomerase [Desulfobacterales bacterium]|nr:3-methylitaconate isomerase [Desulfobacterales bacterium]